jgi:hypothetical protein
MREIEHSLTTDWETPWCMDRWEVINHIIKRYGFERYLEIGISNPRWCFNMVSCREKDGVDPGLEYEHNPANYKMTSDEFFNSIPKDKQWDVIFIDGLHLAQQVIKDVYNSLDHLSPNGFIIMHDCNPPNVWRQRENYSIDGINYPWNGTTWKAYYALRITRPDLTMAVIDTDYGVGVVRRGSQMLAPADNTFYDYNMFDSNRNEYLNLISCNELNSFLDLSDKNLAV